MIPGEHCPRRRRPSRAPLATAGRVQRLPAAARRRRASGHPALAGARRGPAARPALGRARQASRGRPRARRAGDRGAPLVGLPARRGPRRVLTPSTPMRSGAGTAAPIRRQLARRFATARCAVLPGAHETFRPAALEAAALRHGGRDRAATTPSATLLAGAVDTFRPGDSDDLLRPSGEHGAPRPIRRRRLSWRLATPGTGHSRPSWTISNACWSASSCRGRWRSPSTMPSSRSSARTREIRSRLLERGVDRVTPARDPGLRAAPDRPAGPGADRLLRERAARGDAIAQHGLAHRAAVRCACRAACWPAQGGRAAEFPGLIQWRPVIGWRCTGAAARRRADPVGFRRPRLRLHTRALREVLAAPEYRWGSLTWAVLGSPSAAAGFGPAPCARELDAAQASGIAGTAVGAAARGEGGADAPRRPSHRLSISRATSTPSSRSSSWRASGRVITYDEFWADAGGPRAPGAAARRRRAGPPRQLAPGPPGALTASPRVYLPGHAPLPPPVVLGLVLHCHRPAPLRRRAARAELRTPSASPVVSTASSPTPPSGTGRPTGGGRRLRDPHGVRRLGHRDDPDPLLAWPGSWSPPPRPMIRASSPRACRRLAARRLAGARKRATSTTTGC